VRLAHPFLRIGVSRYDVVQEVWGQVRGAGLTEDRVDRRLAAIMAGDIAGYSRLMSIDEEGTLRQLKAHRKELVDPKIAEHRGRIVKTTGDGILVEFVSVVDAVRCAVDIARGMRERNASTPPDRRIEFRTGINVGDIISDGNDIFGDGVNVAARLEGLAEPGGIMVSRVVYEQVRDKLNFGFEDLGEQAVKNIPRPIGVHRISLHENLPTNTANSPSQPRKPDASDRPSIAVLPFTNISGDPEQEYFADGISEDIITGLSKLRWFFVIARNSSFAYKGKAVDVKRAARELGVRYILEGSVRKGGNRVRITAQLIDASTGNHIWADRYDGELTDVFELQDEITRKVVAAIEPKLLEAEAMRSQTRSPEDLGAWDLVMQANSVFWRMTKADVDSAIAMLRTATERYPDYAPAQSMLAFALLFRAIPFGAFRSHDVQDALSLASRAAEIDDSDPWAHLALGWAALLMRRTDTAVEEYQRALDINPNFAAAHGHLGLALALDGQCDKAVEHLEQAVRMSPHDPQMFLFNVSLAIAHYLADRYQEAITFGRKAVQQRAGFSGGHRIYVAGLAQAGHVEEARAALDQLKRLEPELSVAWMEENIPYKPQTMAKLIAGLRKAGLE
jgi:TolB-like protein/class 3 adenylate cyclase/Tfp pilus assembly protein PilF